MVGVGVLDHQANPTPEQVATEARAAEEAGADWLTVSDNSSWRDVWMMATVAAQVTDSILIGPGVTNPYLRHPFHTVSALATLHSLAPDRAMLGVGAGGSALSHSAGIDRRTAAERTADLITLVRDVSAGAPLDVETGYEFSMELPVIPVLVAGRKDEMLRCAGAHADWALVWRIPQSDLDRTVGMMREGAAAVGRQSGPDIVWCPLVAWDDRIRPHLRTACVYSALESPPALFEQWGLTAAQRAEIRSVVAHSGLAAAADLLPDAVVEDIVLSDPDPASVAKIGRSIGATTIAIRNFDTACVGAGVEWARTVTSQL